jgi:hypothetical protein
LEYFDRYFKHGPNFFPSSFNVLESFMSFDREWWFFDLRNEIEHLLCINDYFRWYEKDEIPKGPRILEEVMAEGTVYSYDMVSDDSSLRISGETQQVFAGAAFVRHGYELSCLLLAGENPPHMSEEEISEMLRGGIVSRKKELAPDPSFTTKDRYLDAYPGFAKVIVLTRLDLRVGKHDVRFDYGPGFTVFTDDFSVLGDFCPPEVERLRQVLVEGLLRYDELFSALSSMIYLPAFFAAFPQDIQELTVSTELHATRDDDKRVRETFAELGAAQCPTHRVIRCFPVTFDLDDRVPKKIDPPPLEFKSDGYWKPIGPQEIGEGKNGEQIFGRTWVSRHESWSAQSPKSFMLQRTISNPEGPEPGIVYVQRSPALEYNLYKVGLTKRTAEIRASELSSATGVPLPFGVLASWPIGDCARVEREVHERLAAYRINPRREFFRAELSLIIRTVETAIKDLSRSKE